MSPFKPLLAMLLRNPRLYARLQRAVADARQQAAQPAVAEAAPSIQSAVGETLALQARRSESRSTAQRLNLLIPGLSEQHVFGGIATALDFAQRMHQMASADLRLLVLDEPAIRPRQDSYYGQWPVYSIGELQNRDPKGSHIVACGDRYGRSLPVSPGDRFIATIWWSALHARSLTRWQLVAYPELAARVARFVYLIQDFEPGFYPWSSRYALALDSYASRDEQIAVFNSSLLHEFFVRRAMEFPARYCLEPRLQPRLRAALQAQETLHKERLLLAYGRPGVPRNAFELVVAGLRQWIADDARAAQWRFASAGEVHEVIDLGAGKQLEPLGKLSLDHYAALLQRTAIGLSLMLSPHPSYPPLEMAAFGARVVTNTWENKDLSAWSPRIRSVARLDPASISQALAGQCDAWESRDFRQGGWPVEAASIGAVGSFTATEDPFDFLPQLHNKWLGRRRDAGAGV